MELLHFLFFILCAALCFYIGSKLAQPKKNSQHEYINFNQLQEMDDEQVIKEEDVDIDDKLQDSSQQIKKAKQEIQELQAKEKNHQLELKSLKEKKAQSPSRQNAQKTGSKDLLSDQDFDSLIDETTKNAKENDVFDEDDFERQLNEATQ